MLDFMLVSTRPTKNGVVEIYPKFIVGRHKDLMIRGGDFYAIWLEDRGLWSTDEVDAKEAIDRELDKYVEENKSHLNASIRVMHLWDAETGMIDSWHKFCQKQLRDSYTSLDENLLFSNSPVNRKDFASKRLPYPLEAGSYTSWDKLISTLYAPEQREKIEWAIGAIVCGDSKKVQKFLVFYGAPGSGKSTILNVIQEMFKGYYAIFDAKALGSSSNQFALEAFKSNPLVAIEHDGDLSRIEDNTRLNSIVSHEEMLVNTKFKAGYTDRFKAMLLMGTNKPVKITDTKSGLLRRLIDVHPSGDKLSKAEYESCMSQISFELGAIAMHCKEVYLHDPSRYDAYTPTAMMSASNDFFNFIEENQLTFTKENCTTLKAAWAMYGQYVEDAKVNYPLAQRQFKEELKSYFKLFEERHMMEDGTRARNYYSGFLVNKLEMDPPHEKSEDKPTYIIDFNSTHSLVDEMLKDCPAQYAGSNDIPAKSWDSVETTLKDIDTSKVHYVKPPVEHIIIDFDLKNEKGEKDFQLNLQAASKWPKTYAELSKGGSGIHLHYIYTGGDPAQLKRVYDDDIEIKVYVGKSSLRRRVSKCNTLPVATISSGLPIKEEKMVNFEAIQNEKGIRTLIAKNMRKEIHPGTKPSIDFIYTILEDAYNSGVKYDVSDMKTAILSFAFNSHNQAEYCTKLVLKMKFKSDDMSDAVDSEYDRIVFWDVEVFPNLFLVNWKFQGKENPVVRMINPTPQEIEELCRYKLIGFNCRRYDNHMMYARMMGYTEEQMYKLSKRIIDKDKNAMFSQAYNISYTDVYDFASAGNKQSLKKFEIELGLHHQELGLPWDEPVPEERWGEVAEYCDNDVISTEATFDHLSADWSARQILADIAGMTVNDTTNTLTTKIIFGNERKPQGSFNYRNLAMPVYEMDEESLNWIKKAKPKMMTKEAIESRKGSLLPFFPGYKFEYGVSTYRGIDVGEGGEVYAEPGIHFMVALLDVNSMHPNSTIDECLFGPRYTQLYKDIVDGRVTIKHEDWDNINNILDGRLTKYVEKVKSGEMTSKDLANALKTAINSVYGLTAARFEHQFKDPRNIDNIVAKRGALFMIDLMFEVQKRGYTVAHIKTDSIKIPNADKAIIDFVNEFGELYGYTFEHEATYEKMCLVNNAVYIAKYADANVCQEAYGYVPGDNKKKAGKWTATGTQFQVPYIFKTLFSKEQIEFKDMCETKQVKSTIYLDFNEANPDNHDYHFIGKIGSFCPVKPTCGGGELVRENGEKYAAVTGTKGYRWMEAEEIAKYHLEDNIDKSYYTAMVDDAIAAINKYGDFDDFVSERVGTPKLGPTNKPQEPSTQPKIFNPGFVIETDPELEEMPFI